MRDVGDGGGIDGVVEMCETTDIVFGFGDLFKNALAMGAGKVGGVSFGPEEWAFALVVGAAKAVLGEFFLSFLFDKGGWFEEGVFVVRVGWC